MKSQKISRLRFATIPIHLTADQVAALRILTRATGDQNDGRLAAKVFSLGLFVLGIDPAGDFCLDELTVALYGKSEVSQVNQSIEDAGHEAEVAWSNRERVKRAQTYREFSAEATS